MTVFAKKSMTVVELAKVQDQIGRLQMLLEAPHDLMMFSAKTADSSRQDIYIGLPNAAMLTDFPGFQQVDQGSLPDFLATLVAREDGFEDRFPDIYRKRRSEISASRRTPIGRRPR
jgi:hypothetical protein